MRQVLVFIKFGDKGDRFTAPSIHVRVPGKPSRVWTLFRDTDENAPPTLPIKPQHRVNAFLEDRVHDWTTTRDGLFKYFSRVTDEPVWVLLEYDE